VTIRVRRVTADELDTWIEIKNRVTPDWPADREGLAWAERTYPGGIRLLADLEGTPVAGAVAGRIYVQPPEYPEWWAEIVVLPEARRRGVGTALLAACSAAARDAGKTGLISPVSEARPEGAAFALRHGFVEHERSKAVRLDLADASVPEAAAPQGLRLTTLAERPDLVPGIHAVALATFPDIPGGDPMAVGDLDEFRARDVDRPGVRADGFQVALDGDRVVGYASVIVEAGRPGVGFHDMTAVLPEWRGRGLATALKRATIAWAAHAGLEALETGNDEANAAMRAVNARLGYRPLPDIVFFRGPLLEALATA
jgi:GNAT superfamily N-acetyltransferase